MWVSSLCHISFEYVLVWAKSEPKGQISVGRIKPCRSGLSFHHAGGCCSGCSLQRAGSGFFFPFAMQACCLNKPSAATSQPRGLPGQTHTRYSGTGPQDATVTKRKVENSDIQVGVSSANARQTSTSFKTKPAGSQRDSLNQVGVYAVTTRWKYVPLERASTRLYKVMGR